MEMPASLTKDLLDIDGRYKIVNICKLLGFQKSAFEELTGRSTKSVARVFRNSPMKPRDGRTRRVVEELIKIVVILRGLGVGEKEIARWMNAPLLIYSNKSPREVIANGNGSQLIALLLTHATGNIGT